MDSLTRVGISVPEDLYEWAKKEGHQTFESYKLKCQAISFK